jgi:hypothetical protein
LWSVNCNKEAIVGCFIILNAFTSRQPQMRVEVFLHNNFHWKRFYSVIYML